MSEIDTELVRRLVTGRKNDGRAVYDPQAKAELVRACLRPGVSVAGMAMQYGVNANLLRRWMTEGIGMSAGRAKTTAVAKVGNETFVPLQIAAPKSAPVAAPTVKVRLHARLPNGVELDLSGAGFDALSPVIQLLGRLPCSDSTTR
jgi:transposase-like protein